MASERKRYCENCVWWNEDWTACHAGPPTRSWDGWPMKADDDYCSLHTYPGERTPPWERAPEDEKP